MKNYLIEGNEEIQRLEYQNKIDIYNLNEEMQHFDWEVNDNVLDAGCGSGNVIEILTKKNLKSIHGIDLSPDRVSYTQKRFRSHPEVTIFNGSLTDTKLKKNN